MNTAHAHVGECVQVKSRQGMSGLKRSFARAFAGNLFYTACQGAMTLSLARLGPPELLGTFGIGVAVTAPIIEMLGLQLPVVESVDTKQQYAFRQYLFLNSVTSMVAFVTVLSIACCGSFDTEARWTILACGISKIIETACLICHGKMQQIERIDLVATSLSYRGVIGLVALVSSVWMTGSVSTGVFAMSFAWGLVLMFYDIPNARSVLSIKEKGSRITADVLAQIAWKALPLGVFMGLNSLMVNAPRYFVENSLGTRELGIFSALAYLSLAARSFYTSLLNAVLARLADHHSNGEIKHFLKIISEAAAATVGLGFCGCLAVYFAGHYVLMAFGRDFASGEQALILLTAAMSLKSLWMVFVSALYAMKRFRLLLALHLCGGIVLFKLLSLWVADFGIVGAAWAILSGSLFDVTLFSTAVIVLISRRGSSKVQLKPSLQIDLNERAENE